MSVPQPSDHLTALVRTHSTFTGSPGRKPTCTGCNTTLTSFEDHNRHIADVILEHYELKNAAVPTNANIDPTKASAAPVNINTHPIK